MGYFCPKNTFLQLKHYIQGIYLTLLLTTCVKIHQISYVIFQPAQLFCIFLVQTLKQPITVQIFRLSTTWAKIHQIPYVIFQTKSQFSSNFESFFSVMRDNSSVLFQLKLYILLTKKQHIKVQIFWLVIARIKIHQIPSVIFGTKSHLFFKLCITLQCHET